MDRWSIKSFIILLIFLIGAGPVWCHCQIITDQHNIAQKLTDKTVLTTDHHCDSASLTSSENSKQNNNQICDDCAQYDSSMQTTFYGLSFEASATHAYTSVIHHYWDQWSGFSTPINITATSTYFPSLKTNSLVTAHVMLLD